MSDERNERGQFAPGNQVRLRHGDRRRPLPLREARQTNLFNGWIEHLGGAERLSTDPGASDAGRGIRSDCGDVVELLTEAWRFAHPPA